MVLDLAQPHAVHADVGPTRDARGASVFALSQNGAQVRREFIACVQRFDIRELVGLCEQVYATPVQAAVRRIDESVFARLNGADLMYVEDAARGLRKVLAEHYASFDLTERHLENLHAHDALTETESDAEGVHPLAH
ncbi:GTP cyclohydrolase [Xanthomonas fragariae]|nr:GTP cyclohydrolase [Xanthomonas fragariae]